MLNPPSSHKEEKEKEIKDGIFLWIADGYVVCRLLHGQVGLFDPPTICRRPSPGGAMSNRARTEKASFRCACPRPVVRYGEPHPIKNNDQREIT